MIELIVILAVIALIALIEAFISMWLLAFVGVNISFKVLFVILFLANLFFGNGVQNNG